MHINVQAKSIAFEQEIYDQFTYKKDRSFFHSFPGDVSAHKPHGWSGPLLQNIVFACNKIFRTASNRKLGGAWERR